MKRLVETMAVVLALTHVMSAAQATPITYQIVPRFPAGPVVLTGTLTTDGTIGPLATQDIVAWSFLLQDTLDSRSSTLSSTNGTVFVEGNAFVASAGRLTFMFHDSMFRNSVNFTGPLDPSNYNYWFFLTRSLVSTPAIDPNAGAEHVGSGTGYSDQVFKDSLETIAVALPASVPEPPALAIFGIGLTSLAIGRFRPRVNA